MAVDCRVCEFSFAPRKRFNNSLGWIYQDVCDQCDQDGWCECCQCGLLNNDDVGIGEDWLCQLCYDIANMYTPYFGKMLDWIEEHTYL